MVVKAANRIGRRAPLSLRTTDELRSKLEQSASESGRNLTLEVERRLELSYEWERAFKDQQIMLAEHKAKLAEMEDADFAVIMKRRGCTAINTPKGRLWAEPGVMLGAQSGFIEETPQYQPALLGGVIEEALDRIVRRAVADALDARTITVGSVDVQRVELREAPKKRAQDAA